MSTAAPDAKKPIWKKLWLWAVIGGVIVVGMVGNALGYGTSDAAPTPSSTPTIEVPAVAHGAETPAAVTPKVEPTPPTTEERLASDSKRVCDEYGIANLNGYRAHWTTGILHDGMQDGRYFLKYVATAKNGVGNKTDVNVECWLRDDAGATVVDDWLTY